MSIINTLRTLFSRDLNRLADEVKQYSKDANLWKVDHQITNSGGNLALHLIGNLNAYIAANIGASGYERQRPLEFSQKDVPRAEILRMIEETQIAVDRTLENINPDLLNKEYPVLVFDEPQTYQHFLMHLATHLTYHLGQVNYHRRLLDH